MSEEQVTAGDDREGPPPTPAGVADERFAANIREHRELAGKSQNWLAEQMAARGFNYYPQTVHRIESGTRKVSVGEAKAIAEILGSTVDRLTWPGRAASAASLLGTYTARAHSAWDQVAEWTAALEHAKAQLALTLSEAEAAGYHGSAEIARLAAAAREARGLDAGEAVAAGLREYRQPGEEAAG